MENELLDGFGDLLFMWIFLSLMIMTGQDLVHAIKQQIQYQWFLIHEEEIEDSLESELNMLNINMESDHEDEDE